MGIFFGVAGDWKEMVVFFKKNRKGRGELLCENMHEYMSISVNTCKKICDFYGKEPHFRLQIVFLGTGKVILAGILHDRSLVVL